MSRRQLSRYSRQHSFNYPQYGRKVRKLTNNRTFAKASRAEDSAGALYKALKAPAGSRRRQRGLRQVRKGTF